MDRIQSIDRCATFARFGYFPESVTRGSRKLIVFTCEFCGCNFESTFKSTSRTSSVACSKCKSVSAAYTSKHTTESKHDFWLARRAKQLPHCVNEAATREKFGYDANSIGTGSKRKVVATCEFCLNEFITSLCLLTKASSNHACKQCDAIASHYSKRGTGDKHQFWETVRSTNTSAMDVEGTIAEFGHDPLTVSTYSTKKIVAICSYCGSKVRISMSKYSQRQANIACPQCVRNKTVKTLQDKYGVSTTLDIPSVRQKLANPKTEQIVEAMLRDTYKVEFDRNFTIGPYSFDFHIPSKNLLVECQGDFFHGFKQYGYSGTPKDRAKSTYVEDHTSHKLVWVWEHEIHAGRIKKILDYHIGGADEPAISFKLGGLEFKRIQNASAHAFLSRFHYLGNLGMVATCYGAFFKETLMAVCVFGGVTRQQSIGKINTSAGTNYGPKQIKELRRFCIRPRAHMKNMGSYCLRRFVDLHIVDAPDTCAILSFSDTTVGDLGTIYKASNWKRLSDTPKSYHYLDPSTSRRLHKRTVWGLAKSNHMSEADFARQTGFVLVNEDPKSVWLKVL